MTGRDGFGVVVEPTLVGRLGSTYPASKHDVELRLDLAAVPAGGLAGVLRTESDAVLAADPTIRKVVFAAPAGDLEVIGAAEQAGFRYVVDVDLPGLELSLLVREPGWVTQVDMDLDRVPT
ncbi:hypothetical protein [Nocardioides sp.]|jgi:hypothetical protein|uniref:hypothetical protein n=1 Tax=Nocardioides sp. TaxID=35761 RepID=UPI0026100F6D|nr:hypothetical protein [Nocardioides sp.]